MFPEAVRAVKELQPSAFLFENVRGLLRPQFANYVQYICLQLAYPDFPVSSNVDWTTNFQRLTRHDTSSGSKEGLHYKVHLHRANAADFGVPQHRHRVFFIGFRADLDVGWYFPTPTHTGEQLAYDQIISGDYWKRHGIANPNQRSKRNPTSPAHLAADLLPLDLPWRTVRDAFVGLADPREGHSFSNHQYQPGARAYPGHTGSPLDQPSKALKAGDHGVPGGENMLRHRNGRVRYFTVRESARIQTFPDDYIFSGSWTESMRQLGNAVPVKLAFTVANSIANKIRPHVGRTSIQSS
jgi:DNA (cytosine-5)-methyltransferase 1